MSTLRLEDPLIITARLLPGVRIGEGTVSLDPNDWAYYIDLDNGVSVQGSDFRIPRIMSSKSDSELVREAMGSFLSFLSAFAESLSYGDGKGENSDLFPEELAEWALDNADDISIVAWDLEEETEE